MRAEDVPDPHNTCGVELADGRTIMRHTVQGLMTWLRHHSDVVVTATIGLDEILARSPVKCEFTPGEAKPNG